MATNRYNPEQAVRAKKWGRETLTSVKASYASLITSPSRSGDGARSLKVQYKMDHGEVSRISFKMARHLVFVHGGYGKGVGGEKGSSWLNAKGVRKKTNPRSLGAPRRNRRAKEWLNPVLEREVPKLIDSLAEEKLDAAVNAIYLR